MDEKQMKIFDEACAYSRNFGIKEGMIYGILIGIAIGFIMGAVLT